MDLTCAKGVLKMSNLAENLENNEELTPEELTQFFQQLAAEYSVGALANKLAYNPYNILSSISYEV